MKYTHGNSSFYPKRPVLHMKWSKIERFSITLQLRNIIFDNDSIESEDSIEKFLFVSVYMVIPLLVWAVCNYVQYIFRLKFFFLSFCLWLICSCKYHIQYCCSNAICCLPPHSGIPSYIITYPRSIIRLYWRVCLAWCVNITIIQLHTWEIN